MHIQSTLTRPDGSQCVQEWHVMPTAPLTDKMNFVEALFCKVLMAGEILTLEVLS